MKNVVPLAEKRHDPDALLTAAEVGTWIGCSARTIQRAGIPCVPIRPRVTRYRVVDVRRWLEEHVRGAA